MKISNIQPDQPRKVHSKVQSTNAKQRQQKGANKSNDEILIKTSKAIEDCINLSVDKEKYSYNLTKNTRKLQNGIFSINVRIYSKVNPDLSKTLLFTVDKDMKTSLIHVVIIDSHPLSPSVLFIASDQYPITKLEKYVPSIVSSTQNMIK